MRYKIVPEPRGLDTLSAVHRALPLVPERVEDCCARVVDRTDVLARDDAREWLTFLQALELAEETPRGFRRVRTDPETAELADAFRRRVYGAEEFLTALEETGPVTAGETFDRLRSSVPEWEWERHADPEREWRDRTRRLLAWSVEFGLATCDPAGDGERYVPVEDA